MEIFALIINRFAKISGALVKGVAYIFHRFFPHKRFEIPTYSKAKLKGGVTKIPKTIWQTNFTNKVTLPVYVNYLFNRLLSLDWDYRYVSTEDRDKYIKNNSDKITYTMFSKLTDGAAQADFWRIFVLLKEGGLYLDIDAHLVYPATYIVDSNKEIFIRAKRGHINNYFLATAPNNMIFQQSLEVLIDNIKNKKVEGGVFHLTGPAVINKATEGIKVVDRLYKYIAIQGSFTNEYFQYIDKKGLKWNKIKNEDIIRE